MRREVKTYIVNCDSCHKEIKGVIYQGKDFEGKIDDLCRACYIKYFGSTWQYVWFKIHNWIYAIVALIIAYFLYQLEGNDIYVFWGTLATIGLVYFVLKEQKFISEQTRRKIQNEQYEKEKNGNE